MLFYFGELTLFIQSLCFYGVSHMTLMSKLCIELKGVWVKSECT